MSLADQFWDNNHAQSYLGSSVIKREDGAPVLVVEATKRSGKVTVRAIDTTDFNRWRRGNVEPIRYDLDRDFDLGGMRLGFVNKFDGFDRRIDCYKLRRGLWRQWKVGLTHNNSSLHQLKPDASWDGEGSYLYTDYVRDCIAGVYPSFNDAVDMLDGKAEKSAVAFSRNFAIDASMNLHHVTAGKVGRIDGGPVLQRKFNYLQEQLEMEQDNG